MNDEKGWVSVSDVSGQLGIPDATIRRYIRQHGHHLQLKKRHKSYMIATESIEILIRIREGYSQGMNVEDVEEALAASGAPTIITVTDVDDHGDRVTVNVGESLSGLRNTVLDLVNEVKNQQEVIRALGQVVQQQQQAATAISLPDFQQQRIDRLNERLTERRVERKLEEEALELWAKKPESERIRRSGWFRKEEDRESRDRFVRKYIDEHYEARICEAYDIANQNDD